MKKKYHFFLINLIIGIVFLFSCCEKDNNRDLPLINVDSVSIGLYIDNGAWPELKAPTKNIVKQIGFSYTILTNDSIIR